MTTRRSTKKLDTTPAEQDRLLTIREVSLRLTLSRTTIWRMASRGELPRPIRITPARVAFSENALNRWIADRAADRA